MEILHLYYSIIRARASQSCNHIQTNNPAVLKVQSASNVMENLAPVSKLRSSAAVVAAITRIKVSGIQIFENSDTKSSIVRCPMKSNYNVCGTKEATFSTNNTTLLHEHSQWQFKLVVIVKKSVLLCT